MDILQNNYTIKEIKLRVITFLNNKSLKEKIIK